MESPFETIAEAPFVGPVQGPAEAQGEYGSLSEEEQIENAPQSPYSADRALLRNLTLPSVPNYSMIASPPGSPVPSTNEKFQRFLELKNQGVHFNNKLATSSALKNPSLMQKLMDFADVDETEQYASTLPKRLWNPAGFPDHAYKEELTKSQQKILRKREEAKASGSRNAVEFVAAGSMNPQEHNGAPMSGEKPSSKSTAERVMAGLDRGRSNSPQVAGAKRKTRFES